MSVCFQQQNKRQICFMASYTELQNNKMTFHQNLIESACVTGFLSEIFGTAFNKYSNLDYIKIFQRTCKELNYVVSEFMQLFQSCQLLHGNVCITL